MRATSAEELAAPLLWANAEITITGEDISGLTLSLQPAPRMSGRVVFESTVAAAPATVSGSVTLTPVRVEDTSMAQGSGNFTTGRVGGTSTSIGADGTFNFRGVLPNTYDVSVGVPPADGWRLRSVVANGQDLLDRPLTLTGAEADLQNVIIAFTDRHTELTGVLQTPTGAPATDYYVVAFSADQSMWRPGGRRLAFSRPASDGAFLMRDLPPGDYYLAALADLDPHDWQRSELLEQIVPAAVRVTIGDAGPTVQSLQIAR